MNVNTLLFLGTTFAGTLMIAALAFIIGRSAAELLRLRFDSFPEETACSIAAGLGIIALVVFLIGINGLLFWWVLVFAIALLLMASVFILRHADRPLNRLQNIPGSYLLGNNFFII